MKNLNNFSKQIILFVFAVMLIGCTSNKKQETEELTFHHDSGEIFHTYFHIKYDYSRSVKEEIMEALEKFDQSLNPFRENSIIHKVNNNVPTELDALFTEVFNKSMEISRKTDGKFDVTASPFINAWGFGFKDMDNVTPEKIDSMKVFVGYNKIRIENGAVVKDDPRVQINTSAIAKGYSCDIVADVLESFGINNYMVEIGGEITMKGTNEKGDCWRIGIDKPTDDALAMNREVICFYFFLTVVWIFRACLASFIEPWPLQPIPAAAIGQLIASDALAAMMIVVSVSFINEFRSKQ